MKILKVFLMCLLVQTELGCSSGGSGSPAAPSTPKAALSLVFSDVTYEYTDMHYYTHTRTFTESNGVGVTLTSGQGCYESTGSCDPKVSVNYRIEGNDNLLHTGKKFGTPSTSDRFTLKYWGVDDNGSDVYIEQVMTVAGVTHDP